MNAVKGTPVDVSEMVAKGVITALLTPTDKNGTLLVDATRRLIAHVVSNGVHGVFTVGTTGEYYALPQKTKTRVTEVAIEECSGKVPVYMGVAGYSTSECIKQARIAQRIGADAVTVLAPAGGRFSEDELIRHFSSIAGSVDIPVVLYGNPERTGVGLAAGFVRRLSEIPNIRGIKDSSGDLRLAAEYLRLIDSSFRVLAGRDTLILSTLGLGGCGAVAATSNIVPDLVVAIYDSFQTGNYNQARQVQFRLAPLRHAFGLGSTSAAMLKAAAAMIGLDVGVPVAPSLPLSAQATRELEAIMAEVTGEGDSPVAV